MTKKQKAKILKGIRKKDNLTYWDNIDDLVEEFIMQLAKYSYTKVKLYQEEYDDEDFDLEGCDEDELERSEEIMWLATDIRDIAVKKLEEDLGAWFPYVDEPY